MKLSSKTMPWLAAAILLVFFAAAVASMTGDAPTFDEQGFLVRGLAYLRGEEGGKRDIRVGHPLGLNALNAALLVNDPSVRLPTDHPSWNETSFHRPAELFLWEIGNDVEHIMFLARMPTIWLGLLLAAVAARWTAEMAASWLRFRENHAASARLAGLVALALMAFDPNILAHTRLVTTDLGLAAVAALAGYVLWRFVRRPDWLSAAAAGAALGLLLNTKFTALLFLPLFALVGVAGIFLLHGSLRDRSARRLLLLALSVYPLAAFITLWAGHGFQAGPLNAPLPLVGDVGGAPVPLSSYFDQLLDIGNRLEVSTPSFLLGQYSDAGWWYYFIVAFLLKTPLPALILLGWSAVIVAKMARSGDAARRFDLVALVIPAAGYFAIALTTSINLGYRHLLPILPFLYVFISVSLVTLVARRAGALRWAAAALLGWFVFASLWIYPHYLAFFNILAGGSQNGWRALVDSNLDWGQDLGRLANRLDERDDGPIWLSYFGEARPEYYGIDFIGLDSFAPRLMNPRARPYYPHDPAPGLYAISATTLQGVHFANHDQFAVFREREPVEKIGYSIFLYEQPARGAAADLLLGGAQVDQLAPEHFELLGTNDVTLRWFDAGGGLLMPDGARPIWLALAGEPSPPALSGYLDFDPAKPAAVGDGYRLFRVSIPPAAEVQPPLHLTEGAGEIAFTGAQPLTVTNGMLNVTTTWRQLARPQPVKIFVHVLDASGALVTQWDGLAAEWEGWREGDTMAQFHILSLTGLPAGDYQVVAGLYNPETMQRWRTVAGMDIIELGSLSVP